MDVNEFIQKLEPELEGIEPGSLKADTNYRELKNWSSMYALIIIAFADTEMNVTLNGEDLRKCQTMNDLYEVIKSRM